MKLADLAARVDGTVRGDGDVEVHRLRGIEEAQAGDLTFVASPKYARFLSRTRASAVIVTAGIETALPCLISKNPYLTLARALAVLHPETRPAAGVHASAQVDASAVLGAGVHVGPLAVVGPRVRVGARSVIRAHVVIDSDVEIGEDCLLHSGVRIRERCRLGNRDPAERRHPRFRRIRLRQGRLRAISQDPADRHRGSGGRR
jgi:UDP-3-O-[3-hydroxymyristoyl] glucosamine N-acyltransferase